MEYPISTKTEIRLVQGAQHGMAYAERTLDAGQRDVEGLRLEPGAQRRAGGELLRLGDNGLGPLLEGVDPLPHFAFGGAGRGL